MMHRRSSAIALSPLVALSLFLPAYTTAEVIPEAASIEKAEIGQGYSSKDQTFAGLCLAPVKVNKKFAGSPKATLNFKQSLGQENLSKELGFTVGARARFGVVSMSASAQFASASTSSTTSLSSVYSADYTFRSEILSAHEYTDLGKRLRQNADRWKESCGDQTVTQVDYGARLFFSIRLDFTSQTDRNAFAAQFSIGSPALQAEATLKTAQERFGKRVDVTISVLQIGGDVTQFSTIFNATGDKEESLGFVSCTLGEFEKCSKTLAQVIDYATNGQRLDAFPAQLKRFVTDSSDTSPVGLATLRYLTKPYPKIGVHVGRPIEIGQSLIQVRQEVSVHFEKNLSAHIGANRLLAMGTRRTEEQTSGLTALQAATRDNLATLEALAVTCYEGSDKECIDRGRSLPGVLTSVALDALNVSPVSFAQACDLSSIEGGDAELKHTVKVMVEHARGRHAESGATTIPNDHCLQAEKILERLTDISLTAKDIRDISPFGFLPALKDLALRRNKIIDPASLGRLRALKWLDLSDNQIQDLSSLSGLTLEWLVAINNSRSLKCPFADSRKCYLVSFKTPPRFEARPDLPFPLQYPCAVQFEGGGGIVAAYHLVPAEGGKRPPGEWPRELFVQRVESSGSVKQLTKNSARGTAYESGLPATAGISQMCSAVQVGAEKVLVVGYAYQHLVDLSTGNVQEAWPLGNGVSIARRAGSSAPPMVALRDGRILVFGPNTYTVDVGSGAVTRLGVDGGTPSVAPRTSAVLTKLRDGRVLITGGHQDNGAYSALLEIFDPVTNRIESAVSMTRARRNHTAVELADGRVLISGGYGRTDSGKLELLTLSEIFDPSTNQVRRTYSGLASARAGHSASLLPDGSVLLAGGVSQTGRLKEIFGHGQQTAEIYVPAVQGYYEASPTSIERSNHVALRLASGHILLLGGGNWYERPRTGHSTGYNIDWIHKPARTVEAFIHR